MINVEVVLSSWNEYCNKPVEDVLEEVRSIIKELGVKEVSELTGLSKHCLYRYCKKLSSDRKLGPDFISYCKVLQCGGEILNKQKRRFKRNGRSNINKRHQED